MLERHGGTVVSAVPSHHACPRGFTPGTPVSSHSPKTCKLGVGLLVTLNCPCERVNVSVNGCSPLYVSPVMNWRLVQGVTCLCPMTLG